jgi:hypothetical protein
MDITFHIEAKCRIGPGELTLTLAICSSTVNRETGGGHDIAVARDGLDLSRIWP